MPQAKPERGQLKQGDGDLLQAILFGLMKTLQKVWSQYFFNNCNYIEITCKKTFLANSLFSSTYLQTDTSWLPGTFCSNVDWPVFPLNFWYFWLRDQNNSSIKEILWNDPNYFKKTFQRKYSLRRQALAQPHHHLGLHLTLLEGGRVQPRCAHLPGAEGVAADGWHAQAWADPSQACAQRTLKNYLEADQFYSTCTKMALKHLRTREIGWVHYEIMSTVPCSWDERGLIPGKAVLGFGLGRLEKALAGDWGLLNAEPCRLGNPCMLGVWEVDETPKFREPMAERGSI